MKNVIRNSALVLTVAILLGTAYNQSGATHRTQVASQQSNDSYMVAFLSPAVKHR